MDRSAILEPYKGREQEAVKNAQELLEKLKGISHSEYLSIRLQMSIRYCVTSFNEVMHLEHNQGPFIFDHFLNKFVEALKSLEKSVQDIRNYIASRGGRGDQGNQGGNQNWNQNGNQNGNQNDNQQFAPRQNHFFH